MQIYIAEGTQQTGPFDLETVKAGLQTGKYAPTQLGWYEGAPGWEPLGKLPGLETAAAPPPPPPAPPAPYPSTPTGSYYPGTSPVSSSPPPPSFVPPTPSAPPAPGSAPAKKGCWATVGGVLLGILAVLGGIAKIARPFTHHSYSSSSYRSSPTPGFSPSLYRSSPASGSPSVWSSTKPTSKPALQTTAYLNNVAQFTSGERQQHYVNFRFNYPSSWEMVSGAQTESAEDFVELNRPYQGTYVETFMVEDFYTDRPSLAAELPTLGAKYMASVDANRPKGSTNYQRVSEGPTKFRGYAAYEYRAQWVAKNDTGQPYNVFVRHLIVAPPTGKNGVILEMSASSSSPDTKGVGDLGAKGEMATILDSFSFL